MLQDSTRVVATDKWFDADESNSDFTNHVFLRLIASRHRFTKVKFTYSIFDACYLRECVFDSCDFTGCRFIATNLHGSTFSGCTFDYATFERTTIDSAVLDTECPPFENLKQRFARSLRVNYQQIGDAAAANKAVGVELRATEAHLKSAWHSNDRYYRNKYKGAKRVHAYVDWVLFVALDRVWGNGESAWKLLRSVIVLLITMAIVHGIFFTDPWLVHSYFEGLIAAPQILMGIVVPRNYPTWYLTVILLVRLIAFGFFMSIIIKRFSRR